MRVGNASADASLRPASVRWGAWLLMLAALWGRTACARACLRVRAVRSRGGQTDRAAHESAAHAAVRTPLKWEKACVRSKDRGRRKEPLQYSCNVECFAFLWVTLHSRSFASVCCLASYRPFALASAVSSHRGLPSPISFLRSEERESFFVFCFSFHQAFEGVAVSADECKCAALFFSPHCARGAPGRAIAGEIP